jgi:acetyltransferase-like isoleucine patch superfamily enzyme
MFYNLLQELSMKRDVLWWYRQTFPGVAITLGAVVSLDAKIGAGCEIGPDVKIGNALLSENVRISGQVKIANGVQVGSGVILKGPLEIHREAVLAAGVSVGAEAYRTPDCAPVSVIGERALVGRWAQILGGVVLDPFCCICAHSRVVGDVPGYGLAGGAPAVLENFVCPQCGNIMRFSQPHGLALKIGCYHCNFQVVVNPAHSAGRFGRVCLPGWRMGEAVDMSRLDPRWDFNYEMG